MSDSFDKLFLKNTLPFWDKLSAPQQQLLLNNITAVHYDQGQNIHGGNYDCIGVLFIKEGSLRTYILSEDGREITLYRLNKGEACILSASCILKDINFDVHIDADSDSDVLIINSYIFEQICRENVYAENFSYKVAAERFSDVMWAMQQILFMSFDKRLAIFLLDEVSRTGSDIIPLTHEQIAKYVGSAREVVSRMLKHFENEGLVELSRGAIRVVDKNKMRGMI